MTHKHLHTNTYIQHSKRLTQNLKNRIHFLNDSSKDGKWLKELNHVKMNQRKFKHQTVEPMRDDIDENAIDIRLKTFTDYQLLNLVKSLGCSAEDIKNAFRRQV